MLHPRPLAIAALVAGCLIAGCGGNHKAQPYKTLRHPPLAGLQTPSCPPGDNHTMGQCLPKPPPSFKTQRLPAGVTCIDLSNNDPVYSPAAWRAIRAHGVRCAVFKVNESAGFVDHTATPMAAAARAAGIAVGGYDFQHVCQVSATAEAHVFAVYLANDRLLGPNTVPPAADAEYPSGGLSCNGRAWELAWRAQVRKETGRVPQTYTGDWWWSPHMGRFDPGGYKWVSGYGVSWPFIPAGWHLDQWQWTSSGWNGASSADVTLFLNGEAAFRAFSNAAPAPPTPSPYPFALFVDGKFPSPWGDLSERLTVEQFAGAYTHRVKYRGYLHGLLAAKLGWLAARDANVATRVYRSWKPYRIGSRRAWLANYAQKAKTA